LVEEIEGLRLDTRRAANPFRNWEVLGRVGAHLIREDVLEGLGPRNTIVEFRKVPEQLQEVQQGRMRVRGV